MEGSSNTLHLDEDQLVSIQAVDVGRLLSLVDRVSPRDMQEARAIIAIQEKVKGILIEAARPGDPVPSSPRDEASPPPPPPPAPELPPNDIIREGAR